MVQKHVAFATRNKWRNKWAGINGARLHFARKETFST